MADVKISAAADIGTVVATDKVPVARSASTTAYAATMAELASYANGAYVPSYFGGSPSMDGTAAPGTSALVGRGDHVHPTDTSRYAASNPSGYQTAAQVAAAVAPYANDVGRNLIHNPMFNIGQRGTGPWTANGYTLDRWSMYFVNGSQSVSAISLTDANRTAIGDEAAVNAMQCVFTGSATAGSTTQFYQAIEAVRRLAGKTVTVSFYAWASAALKLGVAIDQNFGSGGSPSASVTGTPQVVTLTTTPARYSLTFAVPSATGKVLGTNNNDSTTCDMYLSNQANAAVGVQSGTVALWGVQLEVGSVATPLEHIDPGADLRNCQRFYQPFSFISNGYLTSGVAVAASSMLPVQLRSGTVTVTASGTPSSTNITGLAASASATTVWWSGSASGTGAYTVAGNWFASADL